MAKISILIWILTLVGFWAEEALSFSPCLNVLIKENDEYGADRAPKDLRENQFDYQLKAQKVKEGTIPNPQEMKEARGAIDFNDKTSQRNQVLALNLYNGGFNNYINKLSPDQLKSLGYDMAFRIFNQQSFSYKLKILRGLAQGKTALSDTNFIDTVAVGKTQLDSMLENRDQETLMEVVRYFFRMNAQMELFEKVKFNLQRVLDCPLNEPTNITESLRPAKPTKN